MKYLVLLMADGELTPWWKMSADEQTTLMGRFEAFDRACAEHDGVEILSSEALDPAAATTMRTRAGSVALTDGPFAESVEQLGGFYLVETPDLDVLVALLEVLPGYDMQISPVDDLG